MICYTYREFDCKTVEVSLYHELAMVVGDRGSTIKVLKKCTKNLIGHSKLALNNHKSNIDC